MFGLMFWRSTVLLFETLDRSVTEQLQLLAARPPEMLPFMVQSRMDRGPEVVTRVGLFDGDSARIVGDISEIPRTLTLNGKVQAVLAPHNPARHWRVAGRVLPDGRRLVVARSADEILEVRADLGRGAALGIVPAILLSLTGGALVGVATERRLRRLNAIAERIIDGDLQERLPAAIGGDELDRLCAVVNRMLTRLVEVVGALQATGDNIAHDLRTPLTALRARLERALEAAGPETPLGLSIGQCVGNVDQALSTVTALLRISEIRHLRRTSAFETFDLAEVVRETADTYEPVAEEKDVCLSCSASAPAAIVGDRQLMVEALVNVVDNAVKFTQRGGSVRIALAASPAGPTITVADTGPGIPPEARSAVFRRFYRAEASRTTGGSGLGLSLVAEILKLHDFTAVLETDNPGCRIELRCWPQRETEVTPAPEIMVTGR